MNIIKRQQGVRKLQSSRQARRQEEWFALDSWPHWRRHFPRQWMFRRGRLYSPLQSQVKAPSNVVPSIRSPFKQSSPPGPYAGTAVSSYRTCMTISSTSRSAPPLSRALSLMVKLRVSVGGSNGANDPCTPPVVGLRMNPSASVVIVNSTSCRDCTLWRL